MTLLMDAIQKLRSLGYSLTLHAGKLRYTYHGRGNPPKIASLLGILKTHKEEILNDPYFLIEQTLDEINQRWQPGTLEWMKQNRPNEVDRMKMIETEIGHLALGGDLDGLRKALSDYKGLTLMALERIVEVRGWINY